MDLLFFVRMYVPESQATYLTFPKLHFLNYSKTPVTSSERKQHEEAQDLNI